MLKTAQTIALEVFEKLALRRGGKEILRSLEHIMPGATAKYYASTQKNTLRGFLRDNVVNNLNEAQQKKFDQIFRVDPANSLLSRLIDVAEPTGQTKATLATRIKKLHIGRVLEGTPGRSEGFTNDIRTMFTGRHKIRPGEIEIPQSGSPEFVSNVSSPRSPFMYRGNSIPAKLNRNKLSNKYKHQYEQEVTKDIIYPNNLASNHSYLTSRYPDVASGYAAGKTTGYTTPDNLLNVYRRKDLHGVETAADLYGPSGSLFVGPDAALHAPQVARSKFKNPLEQDIKTYPNNISGRLTQKYEMVVPAANQPTPLTTVSVRESRNANGDPTYALKHISGDPNIKRYF